MNQIEITRDGRVAIVTLNDPARRNALNLTMCSQLVDAVGELEGDTSVGAVVITGAPPAFCAGADLTQLGDSQHEGLRQIYSGFLAVANCALPTIAAVNGAAVGAGLNMALACDVRIASTSARFDTRFLELGIHPGGGHTWLMQRIVGPQASAATVLFGQVLDARAAEACGLVWETADDDLVVGRAVEMASRAADTPRELVTTTKATMRTTAQLDTHSDAVDVELEPQVWSINQPAFAERLAAMQRRITSG